MFFSQKIIDQADAKLFSFGGGGSTAKASAITIDNDTIYKMNKPTRGIAVIINNKDFLRSSGNGPLPHVMAPMLTAMPWQSCSGLRSLMLEFTYNQTRAEIRRITKELAITNHTPYDAFVFSILTHGEEGVIYGTDGTMAIKDLTAIFKDCSTLVGKPKMFFFQACQGKKHDMTSLFGGVTAAVEPYCHLNGVFSINMVATGQEMVRE